MGQVLMAMQWKLHRETPFHIVESLLKLCTAGDLLAAIRRAKSVTAQQTMFELRSGRYLLQPRLCSSSHMSLSNRTYSVKDYVLAVRMTDYVETGVIQATRTT